MVGDAFATVRVEQAMPLTLILAAFIGEEGRENWVMECAGDFPF